MKKKIDFILSILLFIAATITLILVATKNNATISIAIYWLLNSFKLGLLLKKDEQ